MQVHQAPPPNWISYVVPILIVGVVMFFRVRRMSRMRPLKLEQLWIVPVMYLAIVAWLFVLNRPTMIGWACAAIGLIAGCALGWYRGTTMRIHVDPETHALNQQASPAGILFLLALIAVRYAARAAGGEFHMNVALITDVLAALALGMFSVQRLEMYLRARRLLDEARAGAAAR